IHIEAQIVLTCKFKSSVIFSKLQALVVNGLSAMSKSKPISTPNAQSDRTAMADEFEFADKVPPSFDGVAAAKGFNPGLIVLLVVVGLLVIFLVGNYALYVYAQRTVPPKKKKPVSKKKLKRERLKQGVSAPGE
ncbi:S1FA-like DNA-binding protein, partial [Prunus dulcis]